MTIWRTQIRDPQERLHDVFVDGEVTTSTEALERELEQLGFHAKPIGFHGVPIRSAGTIGALGLAHGSTLTCGALAPEPAQPGVGRHLVVVCGPDAGRHVPLPTGGGVTDRAFGARRPAPRRLVAVRSALPDRPRPPRRRRHRDGDRPRFDERHIGRRGRDHRSRPSCTVGRTCRSAARSSPSSTSPAPTSPWSASSTAPSGSSRGSTARPSRRCRRRSRRRATAVRRGRAVVACGGGRCSRSSPASGSRRSPAAGSSF